MTEEKKKVYGYCGGVWEIGIWDYKAEEFHSSDKPRARRPVAFSEGRVGDG